MKFLLLGSLLLLGGCALKPGATSMAQAPITTATFPAKATTQKTPSLQPTSNPEPVRSETISPDGMLFATGTLRTEPVWTGVVTVCETKSGKVLAKWRVQKGAAGVAFSHNNKWLAVGGENTLTVWDWRLKRVVHVETLRDKNDFFPDINSDFSSDGRVLAVADGSVKLFDTRRWKLVHTFSLPIVSDVSFSPDGRRVVASCYDARFAFWVVDVRTSKVRPLSEGDGGKAVFSPDGRLVALPTQGGDQNLSVWNVRRAKQLAIMTVPTDSTVRSFSPDARLLAIKNEGGHFEVWRIQDGRRVFSSSQKADSLAWQCSRTLELRSGQTTKRVSIK